MIEDAHHRVVHTVTVLIIATVFRTRAIDLCLHALSDQLKESDAHNRQQHLWYVLHLDQISERQRLLISDQVLKLLDYDLFSLPLLRKLKLACPLLEVTGLFKDRHITQRLPIMLSVVELAQEYLQLICFKYLPTLWEWQTISYVLTLLVYDEARIDRIHSCQHELSQRSETEKHAEHKLAEGL